MGKPPQYPIPPIHSYSHRRFLPVFLASALFVEIGELTSGAVVVALRVRAILAFYAVHFSDKGPK